MYQSSTITRDCTLHVNIRISSQIDIVQNMCVIQSRGCQYVYNLVGGYLYHCGVQWVLFILTDKYK